MTDGGEVESVTRLREIIASAEALLRVAAPTIGNDEPVAKVLLKTDAQVDAARRADGLLTEALETFAEHPCLLRLRAAAREQLARAAVQWDVDSLEVPRIETADAKAELRRAMSGTPDYHAVQLDLAACLLNLDDDAASASDVYRQLLGRLTDQLCECAAGLVESLAEIPGAPAAEELRRWQQRFPDSARLAEAAKTIELFATTGEEPASS